MSTRVGPAQVGTAGPERSRPPARVAVLGVGTVGSALLRRLDGLQGSTLAERLALVYVANSRVAVWANASCARNFSPDPDANCGRGFSPDPPAPSPADTPFGPGLKPLRQGFPPGPGLPLMAEGAGPSIGRHDLDCIGDVLGACGTRIVIDATASERVAERHAEWLARGLHVVTACKLAQGTSLQRWRRIQHARTLGRSEYGDAATVGAGLPLLRSIRELRAGGDRIHALAGVLSGSLAWLFDRYDGKRPFSGFVREAREAGYTEPDPREDLSGEDVRRKLLILARAAGVELDTDAVEVESLVPAVLAAAVADRIDDRLVALDTPLRERFASAWKRGGKLRFIARLQDGQASVGLESLAADDPLAGGAGTDNRLAIWSDRYRRQPLVIQGPGAGAEVTAAALLDDALRIATL